MYSGKPTDKFDQENLAIYPGKQSLKRPKINEKIDQDIMNVTLEKLDMPPLVPR